MSPARLHLPAGSNGSSRSDSACGRAERMSLLENRVLRKVEVSPRLKLKLKFKFKFTRRADVDGFALRRSSRSLARRSSLADFNGSSRGNCACGGTERDRSPVALHFQSLNTAKEQPKEQPKIKVGRRRTEPRKRRSGKIAAKFRVGGVAHG
jgi:hypothetical protein